MAEELHIPTKKAIGDVLVEEGLISQQALSTMMTESEHRHVSLEQVLLESGVVTEKDVVNAQQSVFKLDIVDLDPIQIPEEILHLIPKELAENYRMVPYSRSADVVSLALIDPANLKAREAAEFVARSKGFRVKYVLTTNTSLKKGLKQYGNISREVESALSVAEKQIEDRAKTDKGETENIEEVIKSAPVAKIVSVIMRHAIEGGASDIHIEPYGNSSRVRYRIDGELHTTLTLPLYIHDSLISRVKVLASLKLDETRKPQDGRIHISTTDKDVDFRVSILPLSNHEKVVMRLLETTGSAPTLDQLGFVGRNLQIIQTAITRPHGLFLITGPTGSGKSTTLFSLMTMLNHDDVNISTLEDPIEYRVRGINQSQIHPEVEFTFANGLRSLLRQDPDIILVGEIRDNETADLAVNAALTGHLVLSTLHTNDALGAIPRMIDMKVEPFLIASTLNAVGAQRLARKICDDCKQEVVLPEYLEKDVVSEFQQIASSAYYPGINPNKLVFYKGAGCAHCGNTGYRGRSSIAEFIEVTPDIRDIISQGRRGDEFKNQLAGQGFVTIRQEGIMKALLGITTIEEVWSATKID
ncbi:MAG: hypothetical protein A3H59_02225 [Candidatus Jacksonbacteria bacterium RIFCSPLOWO2_02_FULL_43_9]|nr:MAG: Type IV pilus assembly protein PilB [Parcubacteria group bacterium GW2011_GWA2_43_13]OGY69280.1 MAG: hypothetical protein A3B94_02085 [Candidatus Jacksonbacteria bacterium RIFCSPHIGHO2_02_FULL_43_10]OGY71624.1 MAG: hypothetical protein A2986_01815 [Candidatus Jacksonbacteria bacterium RIFCSPLOWO2_01_FULL_44_13]OGY74421.1 MAG: hypothetical protein A3H59_02225 [Candidatus Jacksonbacteria bacterium RIFCSPLOWO2_02_FULL_43_9]HAZ16624.1 hypothetical protein [Candidatus Jacksonbacteria bacteri